MMIFDRQAALASAAFTILALVGCGEAQQPPAAAPMKIPQKICDDARKSLEQLSRTGSFEYSKDGQASIEEAAWLPMLGGHRDALVQALAFHTACSAAEAPTEVSVTIKNEGGRVLTQRVIETSVDPLRMLEE